MEAVRLKWLAVLTATAIAAATVASAHAAVQDSVVDVIPEPAHVEPGAGVFEIRAGTRLALSRDPRAARIARYFASLLYASRGIQLATQPGTSTARPIVFKIDAHPAARMPPEGYSIDISPDRVVLSASDPRGLLYAAVTLWQLCTSSAAASAAANPAHADSIGLAAMRIADSPRFGWRGLMLDSARHFQSPEFILRLIDWMALHKLNVLHWHLTDDQAWRLEIKKYPRLTSVGAWRVPAGAGPAADIDPVTGRPRLYGGFYSQRTVRQIVAHATARNITIVPEIDLPGHATAAIVAYPGLASAEPAPTAVPADWGVHTNLYNAEPATFEFLQDVLGEVVSLFPGRYVHLGGDEAVKDQWRASVRVHQRMLELGVPTEQALQSYFVARMGKFLGARGRRLIGWDEILDGNIPPDAAVMSWRGIDGAVAAAAAGHDSVLSPQPTLYFDNRQGDTPGEPPGRGRIVSVEDIYRFNPMPAALPAPQRGHVLGLQANVWTEHIRTEERVEYMTFPRAAAVAEVGWSSAEKVNWDGFVARLPSQMSRYLALGIHASDDTFAVAIEPRLERARDHVQVRLSNQAGAGQIHYTLDGIDPVATSPRYSEPLDVAASGEVRAASFMGGNAISPVALRSLSIASLETRSSRELKSCTDKLVLLLEDDAPVRGQRAVFHIDVMNPCWIYEAADLSHVTGIEAGVGQVPFNFQLGADVRSIKLDTPATASGELEVRLDGCSGERIAVMSLEPAVANDAVTHLPPAKLRLPAAAKIGLHALCLRFTQRSLDPLWALDSVQLVE